jgi:cell division protein FtsB
MMKVNPATGKIRLTAFAKATASPPEQGRRVKVDANEVTRPHRRGSTPWIRRALLFVACVILLDSLFGDHGLAQTIRARKDYTRAVDSLERLKAENAQLRNEARRLTGDPAAIEAVAREELGLVRPGEILVVVKDLN